jgi:hypothetical protein
VKYTVRHAAVRSLVWLNTLLGVFLTPLFIIPGTWLLEWAAARRRRRAQEMER